jgi:CRP/FNR family transcriptional regulator
MDALHSNIHCHQCGFSGTDQLRDASRPETCTTTARKKIHYTHAGEAIFRQGDEASGIYNLISGIVMITMVDQRGAMFAPRLVVPGEAFGYRSSLEGGRHTCTALALRDCCYCQITQEDAANLIERDDKVRQAMVNSCTRDIFNAREEMIATASMNLSERLLLFMTNKLLPLFGTEHANGSAELHLPLKRSELALVLGVQGETLSRAIKRIEMVDLARFEKRCVTFPSLRDVENHLAQNLTC